MTSNYDLEHVYFWFTEREHKDECTRTIVPRVARVCRNDKGRRDEWTTYQKVRLNCSIPGPVPYHFDRMGQFSLFRHRVPPFRQGVPSDSCTLDLFT